MTAQMPQIIRSMQRELQLQFRTETVKRGSWYAEQVLSKPCKCADRSAGAEDAVEQILNMFSRTKNNAEFIQTAKKQKFL